MLAYLGTADGRDVEKMIASGNKQAELIYHAMAVPGFQGNRCIIY